LNGPGAVDALSAYADQHGLAKRVPTGTAPAYKDYLSKRLTAKHPPRDPETDKLAPGWIRNEIAALTKWRERLLDPAFVFGQGKVVPGEAGQPKHWATVQQGEKVPLIQLIEHGFVRQDDLPTRSSSGSKTEVFGVEVVTTLARYGFSPGAAFGDTMHFDFIQGYAAVPGGRSQDNMQPNKYGPTGDPAPATPRPAQNKPK
jgi:hypothetical protein